MTTDNKTFYTRLLAVAAAVIAVLVVAKLLFFAGGTASRPALQGTRPAIVHWKDASKHYGEYCTVEGRIVDTYNSGKACFLNFDADYKKSFTAVIFGSCFDKFPPAPEQHYANRTVRVTGVVRKYSSRPEIVLESPEQIEVVE